MTYRNNAGLRAATMTNEYLRSSHSKSIERDETSNGSLQDAPLSELERQRAEKTVRAAHGPTCRF